MTGADTLQNSLQPRSRVAAWVAAALACVVYANSLGNQFCEDDIPIIVQNPVVIDASPRASIWLTDYWFGCAASIPNRDLLYRPLTVWTYRLNYAAAGARAWVFHAVNLALYAVIAALVAHLAVRILGSVAAGVAAGALFAVMPIHTEAVDNIVGRAELLAALGTLGGAAWAIAVMHSPRSLWRLAVVAAAWTALALGAKESGAGILAIMPLAAIWSMRTAPPDCKRRENWQRAAVIVAGQVVVFVGYLLLRRAALGGRLTTGGLAADWVNPLATNDLAGRVRGALQLWGMYWAKMFWPAVLVNDYSPPAVAVSLHWGEPIVLLGIAVLAGVVAFVVTRWRRGDRAAALIAAALVVSYLPMSNSLVLMRTFFAERVWFSPSAWATLLVVAVALVVVRAAPRHGYARHVAAVLAGLAVVLGGGRTWLRTPEWHDNGTLYAAAYRDHPNAVPTLYGLGKWLIEQKRLDEGIALLRRSVLIDIGFSCGHFALGEALLEAGRPHEALPELQTAVAQDPDFVAGRDALAELQRQLGVTEAAAQGELARAVREHPEDFAALNAYASALLDSGAAKQAVAAVEASEVQFAQRADYWRLRATAYLLAGRRGDGERAYRHAHEMAPDDAVIGVEWAMLLLERGDSADVAEAEAAVSHAARLAPQNLQVRMGLAELAAQQGRRAEAARAYRDVAASLPEGELRERCRLRAEILGE